MNEEKGKIYSHIMRYAGLFGSIQALNIIVGLFRNKLVALILGPVGMGLASLFNSTIQLLCNTVNLGIPMSGVREIVSAHESGNRDELKRAIGGVRLLCGIAGVVGMLLCVLLARQLDSWTFSWGDHSIHFMLLAPAVGMTVVAAGEMAILKGLKQLGALAQISVYQVFAVLLLSVPLYYVWGQAAIVPVISLVALSQLVLTLCVSYRIHPPFEHVGGSLPVRRLVTLGSAFVVSGLMASIADFVIRTYINNVSDVDSLGLFNSGFVLINMYAGMVFASMETDYYPRLSAMQVQKGSGFSSVVDRQIEVTQLLLGPMLVALMLFMPIVMPLMYSNEFVPVVGMVQVALLSMYARAAYLPVEYVALAGARSRVYLVQESVSALLLAVFVIFGYWQWGLWGAGVGICFAYFVELLFVLVLSYMKFGYVMSRETVGIMALHVTIGVLAYIVVSSMSGFAYWAVGLCCVFVSGAYSLFLMRRAKR